MTKGLALGVLIGFPIAAAPGPMFFLVLRRTLARGWRAGIFSGAGIASGDGIYAAIAAFGVTALINVLVAERRWIGLIGGIAIIAIGVRTVFTHRPHPDPPPRSGEGVRGMANDNREGVSADYFSTLALTLSNPPTILSFLAVFAALGVRVGSGWGPALALVVGVLLGSAAWWLLLTAAVAQFRSRVSPRVTWAIGMVSGTALILLGGLISLQSL